MTPRSSLLGVVIAMIIASMTPCHAQFELKGTPVVAIEFEADSDFDPTPLRELVRIEPGEPLSVADLQGSIKSLFGTGDFRDVRVDAETVDGGLILTFRLSLHYRVGSITYEVDGELLERARREVLIQSDQVLSLDRVDQSAVSVARIYEREGHLEATVDPEVRFSRRENLADVIFHITSGPRARITSIELEGSTAPFTRETLIQPMRSELGGFYELARAREDAGRMQRHLLEHDHRMAQVRFLGETYDEEAHTVSLRYEIEVGPVVELFVAGVPRKDVRRMLPFRDDEAYSEDRVLRAADRMKDHYQERGFFFVEVDTSEGLQRDRYVITYTIEPGERYELGLVRFEGNHTFTDEELRGVISIGPSGTVQKLLTTLIRRPRGVTTEQLSEAQDSVQNLYRLEGFWSAEVSRPNIVRIAESKLEVVFPVNEGPRTIVESVAIEGAERLGESLPSLELEAGEPLNPQELNQDLVNLQSFYGDRGYVEIQVNPEIEMSDDRTSARVRYQVIEGPEVRFGSVAVRGNSYTDQDVILRKARLPQGEPFSYRTLLEAQQRLYRMGVFRLVDLDPVRSGTAEEIRDVVIRIEEGKNLTVTGSLGYSTEDGARGSASVSHRNLFGTGRYLGVETTISERLNRYVINFIEPFVFGYDLPTQVTVFKRDQLRADEKAKIDSLGASIEMTRVLRDQFRWSLRYEYRINDCVSGELCDLATGTIPIEGIDPEDQEIEISSLTPSAFWDRRNDAVHPTDGFYIGSSLEYAFPLYSADTNFLKGFLQSAVYFPITQNSQIVTSLRIGATEPLDVAGDGPRVPFAERFLAGGETTHRGFEHDRLGIPCETLIVPNLPEGVPCAEYIQGREDVDFIPVGGNGLALFNVEYRFPILGSLRGAVFVDGGNVWRDYSDVDLDDMRYAVGTGVRYLTPVGPLRFDIGYKLDREPWEDAFETFLTLGYGF